MQQEKTKQELRNAVHDQWNQEMLCGAILNVEPEFAEIQPIKPDGGKDGKRDIRCKYRGVPCIGAASFVKHANDDNTQRKQVIKKINEDMKGARVKHPDVRALACFTNMTFTIAQNNKLEADARKLGFEHFICFDRNRLTQVLCSPRGMHIRHQYLRINMTDEEQISFFGNWGDSINDTISKHFQGVSDKTDVLIYLQNAQLPIGKINFKIGVEDFKFRRENTTAIVIDIIFNYYYEVAFEKKYGPALYTIAFFSRPNKDGTRAELVGSSCFFGSQVKWDAKTTKAHLKGSNFFVTNDPNADIHNQLGLKMADLNNASMTVSVSGDLKDKLKNIVMSIDGYEVARHEIVEFGPQPMPSFAVGTPEANWNTMNEMRALVPFTCLLNATCSGLDLRNAAPLRVS
ncbi:hypothetical protein G6L37_04380 [Agrobacterium rubi]|nr:hypothetical protein [Agrobacterium rubi]NTF24589.1 hypothetical protein [Agrobacterium rubi]